MNAEGLYVWVFVGLIAGWLASFVLSGHGTVRYILMGMVGAIAAGFLVQLTGVRVPIEDFWYREIAIAIAGALMAVVATRILV